MKFALSFLLFIGLTINAVGQSTNTFTLKTIFVPTFMYGCEFTIQSTEHDAEGILKMSAWYSTVIDTCKISADHITLITNFFKKPFPIDPTRRGLDGIDVGVNYRSDNVTREFSFWSPDSSSNEGKLAILLIRIMNDSFKKPTTINYIEQLEDYFPHKLGLKKVGDNPLTYKLYRSVSVNDLKQLKDFFGTLIDKKEVYIDMSNFSRMGKIFYPDVKDLITKNANIYWLNPTPTGLKQLREAGVADKNIITK